MAQAMLKVEGMAASCNEIRKRLLRELLRGRDLSSLPKRWCSQQIARPFMPGS
jgi:hypothetical protein